MNPKKYPFIGIDDNGQVGAEWHDGFDYKIISLTPFSDANISLSRFMKTGDMLHYKMSLKELSTHSGVYHELAVPIKELL